MGDINTSDLFLCGVIVNEHGDPVIGVPISNIAVNRKRNGHMKKDGEKKKKGKLISFIQCFTFVYYIHGFFKRCLEAELTCIYKGKSSGK